MINEEDDQNDFDKKISKELSHLSSNLKWFESFYIMTIKYRFGFIGLLEAYGENNQQEMVNHYHSLKESIRKIEKEPRTFTTRFLLNFEMNERISININELNKYIIANKVYNELTDFFLLPTKADTYIPHFYKFVLENSYDEIIKELYQYTYNMKRLAVLNAFANIHSRFQSLDFKEIVLQLSSIFPKVKVKIYTLKDKFTIKNEKDTSLNIFYLRLKYVSAFDMTALFYYNNKKIVSVKVNVYGKRELVDSTIKNKGTGNQIGNVKRKILFDTRSNMNLFSKISLLFEERLSYLLNLKRHEHQHLYHIIYLFLISISDYSDLFQKRCHFCSKVAKYNMIEKSFYPPYYRAFELSKEFYHEDCFQIVFNAAI